MEASSSKKYLKAETNGDCPTGNQAPGNRGEGVQKRVATKMVGPQIHSGWGPRGLLLPMTGIFLLGVT